MKKLFKLKIKIILKKIFYFNFFTKFLSRIFFQPYYKTFRLLKNPTRLRASIWVDLNREIVDNWMINKNENIYNEAIIIANNILDKRKKFIDQGLLPKNTGGGGNEALLYFLIRLIDAEKVLETGVEAGASSQSILKALSFKDRGRLYSSDLAFILKEHQVGKLVSDKYRENWFLSHKGDRKNIPLIFKKEKKFDLIYYDSDKSYDSKKWFYAEIQKNYLPRILVFDDVDRDSFFSEYIKMSNYKFRVFGNTGVIFFDSYYF